MPPKNTTEAIRGEGRLVPEKDAPVPPEKDREPKKVSDADAIENFRKTTGYPENVGGQGKKYQGA